MSPQGWGFLDKMEQLSLEDILAMVRPYLASMVSQKGGRESPVNILSRIVGHPPLPPTSIPHSHPHTPKTLGSTVDF